MVGPFLLHISCCLIFLSISYSNKEFKNLILTGFFREVHCDEMDIVQTYPSADRDYGYMKINEPPMPYNYRNEGSDI